jgi:hypothetical protein
MMGGKGGSQTVGYWYSGTFHMGLCRGPVDELIEIRGDDKTMFPSPNANAVVTNGFVFSPPRAQQQPTITASGTYPINAPNLYGGEKQEGGVTGTLTMLMGEATQMPSPALAGIEGGARPGYRGITSVVFKGRIAAMNPYIKPWAFRLRRHLMGWNTPVWQSSLVRIGSRGFNPAHIIYQCLTDPEWGAGEDPNAGLDLASFTAAAQTLYNEGLGLCLRWVMQDSIGAFIRLVQDHISGVCVVDPTTNKTMLKLLRGDYDAAAMVKDPTAIIDEGDIVEMTSYQYPVINESVNEVTVNYVDVTTNKSGAVTYQNLANVQAQGKVVSESVTYNGAWNADLAARLAARDCHTKSALLIKGETKIKARRWQDVKVGDVKLLSWSREKCALMPIRILEVNYGDAEARTVTISWAQDQFGVPQGTYVQAPPSQWTPPVNAPQPVVQPVVFEATYRDLARTLDTANLNALTPDTSFVAAVARRPAGTVAYSYELCSRIGGADFKLQNTGSFCEGGTLVAAIGPGDRSITVTGFDDLTTVATGTAALLDGEWVRVDSVNASLGVITVGRGCVDTPPVPHAQGASIWFYQDHEAQDATEYLTGETTDTKLLTITSAGMLDPAQATTLSVKMNQRQARPYPPGKLQIQGQTNPTLIEGALSLTWAHRSRLLQADQLIDTTQASIGPETGTTYTVRVYLNGKLDSTTTGITTPSAAPAVSGDGQVTLQIDAVCNGRTSWQPLAASFTYNRGPTRFSEDGDTRLTEAGDTRILEK